MNNLDFWKLLWIQDTHFPKNERMNSFLLVCDMFSFVFWANPRLKKIVSRLSDLYHVNYQSYLNTSLVVWICSSVAVHKLLLTHFWILFGISMYFGFVWRNAGKQDILKVHRLKFSAFYIYLDLNHLQKICFSWGCSLSSM